MPYIQYVEAAKVLGWQPNLIKSETMWSLVKLNVLSSWDHRGVADTLEEQIPHIQLVHSNRFGTTSWCDKDTLFKLTRASSQLADYAKVHNAWSCTKRKRCKHNGSRNKTFVFWWAPISNLMSRSLTQSKIHFLVDVLFGR